MRTVLLTFIPVLSLSGGALTLSACTTDQANREEVMIDKTSQMTISGEAYYREKILLSPGHIFTATMSDISRMDAPSKTIVETKRVLNRGEMPIAFSLEALQDELSPRSSYAVRATIHDPDGQLAWTTDTVYSVSPQAMDQDLGKLLLIRVGSTQSGQNAMTGKAFTDAQLLNRDFTFTDIDGQAPAENSDASIRFGADGQVSGSTGCNRFFGSFERNGTEVTLGAMGSTRRACFGNLMTQEADVLDILTNTETIERSENGALILKTEDGRMMIATDVT